jgi:hypothetical protein
MPERLIAMFDLENRFNQSRSWGVKYRFGAKFADPKQSLPPESYVDCSGYIRWLVFHGSGRIFMLVDGSANQRLMVETEGFPKRDYREALKDESGTVYICFFRPGPAVAGHVWLLRNGKTMESHYGKGINSRSGRLLSLMGRKVYCYRISS